MPGSDPVDLKRRRRLASRVLLADAHRDGPARKQQDSALAREQVASLVRRPVQATAATPSGDTGDLICLAEPVSPEPERESCCARCLRLLPRSVQLKLVASVDLGYPGDECFK